MRSRRRGWPIWSPAVNAARRLGDAIDARCADALAAADAASRQAADARARLTPWSGDADALARIASVAEAEIVDVETDTTQWRGAHRTAADDKRRLAEESAALALNGEALADGGQAVAATDLADARAIREAQWHELRDGLRGIAPLLDPVGASDAYERAVIAADSVADRRFALAEGSGRLGLLDSQAAALALRGAQALARRDASAAAEAAALAR